MKRQSQGFHPGGPLKLHVSGFVKAVKRTNEQSAPPGVSQAPSKGRLTLRLPGPRCRRHLFGEGRGAPSRLRGLQPPRAHARHQTGSSPPRFTCCGTGAAPTLVPVAAPGAAPATAPATAVAAAATTTVVKAAIFPRQPLQPQRPPRPGRAGAGSCRLCTQFPARPGSAGMQGGAWMQDRAWMRGGAGGGAGARGGAARGGAGPE